MDKKKNKSPIGLIAAGSLLYCLPLTAAILPEDRADLLYHSYSGGGVTIDGPSVLARKQIGSDFSVAGKYYVDTISSASIDVDMIAGATRYQEERTETNLSLDYLNGKSILSTGVTNSDENDYKALTFNFGISQSVFGDLTTIAMSYARGRDEISATGDPTVEETADRQSYHLGVNQILTKRLMMDLSYDLITDEGYLQNPYRKIRVTSGTGFSLRDEVYPNTRTSHAVATQALYYIAPSTAIYAQYRYFTDTWGIDAHTYKLGYTFPYRNDWLIDLSYRFHSQTKAEFYSDIFPENDLQTFMARDKELSTFSDHTLGLSVSYNFKKRLGFIDRSSLTLSYHYMRFEYDDFSDATRGVAVEDESLYELSANVIQFYLSIWY